MALRKEYLVCFDVEDNKARRKLGEELLDLGLRRIQKSVFWGTLNKAERNNIRLTFKKLLDETTDLAFLIPAKMIDNEEGNFYGHDKSDFEDWPDVDAI